MPATAPQQKLANVPTKPDAIVGNSLGPGGAQPRNTPAPRKPPVVVVTVVVPFQNPDPRYPPRRRNVDALRGRTENAPAQQINVIVGPARTGGKCGRAKPGVRRRACILVQRRSVIVRVSRAWVGFVGMRKRMGKNVSVRRGSWGSVYVLKCGGGS